MSIIVLSKWTGSGTNSDPYRFELHDVYPGLGWTQLDAGRYSATARSPVRVDTPPPALASDGRFPQLPNGWPCSLGDYQQAMLAAIDLQRAALLRAGFTYKPGGGSTAYGFSLDPTSLPIWQGLFAAALAGLLSYPQTVGTVDHQLASLASAADLQGFYAAGLTRAQTILTAAVQLKAQVMAATTATDLDAIVDART